MNVSQYRTQLLLDEDRYSWLKQMAMEDNSSIAEIVRRSIDEVRSKRQKLEFNRKQKARQNLLKLAGSIKGGPKDVSINHDKYLGEWIYQHKVRSRK